MNIDPGLLAPLTATGPRPSGHDAQRSIVRSWLLMRVIIGAAGLLLPAVLLLGDWLVLDAAQPGDRGSLSAYYHSGMRDVFVGTLVVAGFFLIAYKLFERNLDNTLSLVAGVLAVGVAVFPTSLPDDVAADLTPVQARLGEDLCRNLHLACAVGFIGSLAVLCLFFAIREGNRSQLRSGTDARFSPTFWRNFHLACTGVIVTSVLFLVATVAFDVLGDTRVLLCEVGALLGFGASWLAKGAELDVLLP